MSDFEAKRIARQVNRMLEKDPQAGERLMVVVACLMDEDVDPAVLWPVLKATWNELNTR